MQKGLSTGAAVENIGTRGLFQGYDVYWNQRKHRSWGPEIEILHEGRGARGG